MKGFLLTLLIQKVSRKLSSVSLYQLACISMQRKFSLPQCPHACLQCFHTVEHDEFAHCSTVYLYCSNAQTWTVTVWGAALNPWHNQSQALCEWEVGG